MKITRASYDAVDNRFVGAAIGDDGNRMQIDFVGPSAFLLNRVMRDVGGDLIVEADDDSFTLRSVDPEGRSDVGDLEGGPSATTSILPPHRNNGRVSDVSSPGGAGDKPFRRHLHAVDAEAS